MMHVFPLLLIVVLPPLLQASSPQDMDRSDERNMIFTIFTYFEFLYRRAAVG
jgi:hypothetical protein